MITERRYQETQVTSGDNGWGVKDRQYHRGTRRANWGVLVGPDGSAINVHDPKQRRWTELTQRDAHDLAMELNG